MNTSQPKLLRFIPAVALLLVLLTPNISSAAKAAKTQKVAKTGPAAQIGATAQTGAAEQSVTEAPAKPELDYWLAIDATGVRRRHNFKCRFYENTKGQPCTKNEGRPCKVCGG